MCGVGDLTRPFGNVAFVDMIADPRPFGGGMRRRNFLIFVGGVSAWPVAGRAESAPARPLVAVLTPGSATTVAVEQSDKFELAVNNKTAKTLGLKIPESFLPRADEVIE